MKVETIKKQMKKICENPFFILKILVILEFELFQWFVNNYRKVASVFCMSCIGGSIFLGILASVDLMCLGHFKAVEPYSIIQSIEVVMIFIGLVYFFRIFFRDKIFRRHVHTKDLIHILGYSCILGTIVYQISVFFDIVTLSYHILTVKDLVLTIAFVFVTAFSSVYFAYIYRNFLRTL